jgi:hypothetical protein
MWLILLIDIRKTKNLTNQAWQALPMLVRGVIAI